MSSSAPIYLEPSSSLSVHKRATWSRKETDMSKEEIARRWTTSTVVVGAFNLIMLVMGVAPAHPDRDELEPLHGRC
jgi:hypothetical protein